MLEIMDDKKIIIVGILYIIVNALVLNIVIQIGARHESREDTLTKTCKKLINNEFCFTLFFLLTGGIILSCFYVLMKISRISMGENLSKILATGIQVPIMLFLSGMLIRALQKRILRKVEMNEVDISKTFFVITVFFDIFFLYFNWELSLLILTIIIGKYIWLDCTFKDIFIFSKHIFEIYKYHLKYSSSNKFEKILYRVIFGDNDNEGSDVADLISFSMIITFGTAGFLFLLFSIAFWVFNVVVS